MADNANTENVKKAMLMADAEKSINCLSVNFWYASVLKQMVKGSAEDAADINRYAIICSENFINFMFRLIKLPLICFFFNY